MLRGYCYLPLLEELGLHVPKEKYSFAPEIFPEHSQRIGGGRHYGLYEQAIFQTTRAEDLSWDKSIARWRRIETSWNDNSIRARYAITRRPLARRAIQPSPASPASRPSRATLSIPPAGTTTCTGGSHAGGLTKPGRQAPWLMIPAQARRRSSACRTWPPHAKQLHVFQLHAEGLSWTCAATWPTDPDWWEKLEPGWQRARGARTSPTWLPGGPFEEDLVADGWTEVFRNHSVPSASPRRRRGQKHGGGGGDRRLPGTGEQGPRARGRRYHGEGQGDRRGAPSRALAFPPAVLQAADVQRPSASRPSTTGRTSPWWTSAPPAASSRITREGRRRQRPGSTARSTASSTPPQPSRSARPSTAASTSRPSAKAASRCSKPGATGMKQRCTDTPPAASPNWFYVGL